MRTEEGRKIRKAFIAEPGHVLISADYSQIELRLLAHIGDIAQLKTAFRDGLDIHAMTASEMFGVPIEGMPSDVRRRAKAINFGIVYGISAFGLANQLGIPQGEAGDYIKTYFERFPGIRDYMDRMRAEVREKAFVTTIFGRKINIPAVRGKSPAERSFADRAAINAPIQGAAADVIRRAMIRMPGALTCSSARRRDACGRCTSLDGGKAGTRGGRPKPSSILASSDRSGPRKPVSTRIGSPFLGPRLTWKKKLRRAQSPPA